MEKCPYHEIEPEYVKTVYRRRLDFAGYKSLPELCDHWFYCPECRAEQEKTGNARYRKLAVGFNSRASKAAAAANWNKGIKSLVLRIFKKAVAGK